MDLILEFCIVFLICMAGEWIAAFLPFTLPASVISLLLLLILLLCGGVKERTIQGTSQFLIGNMGLFFIPAYFVSILQLFRVKPRQLPGEASDSASVSESSSSHGKETAHV